MGKFERGKPNPGRKFQPGVSGNPGGKTKEIAEVIALLREGSEDAIKTLRCVMTDKDAPSAARVAAATAWLDRAYGKAPTTVNLRRDSEDMRNLSDDELMAIAAGDSGEDPASEANGSGQPH